MTCYTIPKKGYAEKQAAIVVKYGGGDYIHRLPDGTLMEMPPGIAHFLEHKMFEDEELNLFEAFSQTGAAVNAYTHFTHTVYYFNTINSFEKNLDLLVRLIKKPYFTEKNIKKEKGIVLSEIDMYADNPYWQVYTGLNRAMFKNSTLKQDILGTRESVQSITESHLLNSYNNFYIPENMALICVGDFEEYNQDCQDYLTANYGHEPLNTDQATPYQPEEPSQVAAHLTEKSMAVSIPLFQLGFKALYKKADPITLAASSILADMIAGESSDVYAKLYDLGLIDNQFATEYIGGTYYGVFLFAGTSTQPKEVCNYILEAARKPLDRTRFEVIKRKHIGRFIRSFNSIESLSSTQADLFTKDCDINQMRKAFENVQFEDTQKQQQNHLQANNHALSVIWPIDD